MFRNPTVDLLVVLLIVLLIVGPKRLPGLGKHLGQGLREFKDGITGESKDEEGSHPELTAAATAAAEPASTPEGQPQPSPVPQSSAAGSASDRESAEVGSPDRQP
jgi:sec-independent protein translocase protein TatA